MSEAPKLLRGAGAIGAHLGMSAKQATHRIVNGQLPTFRVGGTPCATPAALDDWRTLYTAGKLPSE